MKRMKSRYEGFTEIQKNEVYSIVNSAINDFCDYYKTQFSLLKNIATNSRITEILTELKFLPALSKEEYEKIPNVRIETKKNIVTRNCNIYGDPYETFTKKSTLTVAPNNFQNELHTRNIEISAQTVHGNSFTHIVSKNNIDLPLKKNNNKKTLHKIVNKINKEKNIYELNKSALIKNNIKDLSKVPARKRNEINMIYSTEINDIAEDSIRSLSITSKRANKEPKNKYMKKREGYKSTHRIKSTKVVSDSTECEEHKIIGNKGTRLTRRNNKKQSSKQINNEHKSEKDKTTHKINKIRKENSFRTFKKTNSKKETKNFKEANPFEEMKDVLDKRNSFQTTKHNKELNPEFKFKEEGRRTQFESKSNNNEFNSRAVLASKKKSINEQGYLKTTTRKKSPTRKQFQSQINNYPKNTIESSNFNEQLTGKGVTKLVRIIEPLSISSDIESLISSSTARKKESIEYMNANYHKGNQLITADRLKRLPRLTLEEKNEQLMNTEPLIMSKSEISKKTTVKGFSEELINKAIEYFNKKHIDIIFL